MRSGRQAARITPSVRIEGCTFDDCTPLASGDSLSWPLSWRGGRLEELLGKIVRLEVKFRSARLYAFRGNFHFLDAQDRWMLGDGKPIDASLFHF